MGGPSGLTEPTGVNRLLLAAPPAGPPRPPPDRPGSVVELGDNGVDAGAGRRNGGGASGVLRGGGVRLCRSHVIGAPPASDVDDTTLVIAGEERDRDESGPLGDDPLGALIQDADHLLLLGRVDVDDIDERDGTGHLPFSFLMVLLMVRVCPP